MREDKQLTSSVENCDRSFFARRRGSAEDGRNGILRNTRQDCRAIPLLYLAFRAS